MKKITRLVILTALFYVNLISAKVPAGVKPPMFHYYRLEVGKTIFYSAKSELKGTNFSSGSSTQTRFWVLAKNPDSSFRIITRQDIASFRMLDDTTRKEDEPQTVWAYFDLFTDGRITKNISLNNFDPAGYFIPLPTDTVIARQGWSRIDSSSQERTRYNLTTSMLSDMVWTIQIAKQTPFDSVYILSSKAVAYHDFKSGLMTRKESEAERGFGYAMGKTTGLVTLDSVRPFDTLKFKPFTDELISYFQSESAYEQILDKVEYNSPDVNSAMANAKSILDEASAAAQDSIVKSMLDADLSYHEQVKTNITEDSLWFAKTINKKAVDWKLKDLFGKIHTLKQFRGKIVILDFWYRGCPWCIRAMPMINQIASDFKDSAVVVLGMNIDKNLDDALFVQDKMKLTYISLQCGDVYKKYGVSGFPTLFVIDKKGIIRDIHIGYSPDLSEKLSNKIKSLLETK